MTLGLADVQKIYDEEPKLKKEDVDTILEWVKTHPHLPELTELQVILFLHSCFYEIEAAQKTIDNYFTLRTNSELLMSAEEELIRRTLASFFVAFLPRRTPDGDAVFMEKLLDSRPELYVCSEHAKVSFMIMSLYFHQFGPANGLIAIYDMEGASLGHLFKINISVMRQLAYFVQEAAPTRIKGVHLTNVNPITRHFIAIMKPFLKKEVYDLFKLHPHSYESLYEYVPKECLPKEYGGDLPPLKNLHDHNLENLLAHKEFFKWHDTQRVDESKREVKKAKGFFSGIQGFFRKSQEN